MPRKPPQRDPIGAYQRKATAERRIGVGAQCACGETRPEALIEGSNPIICAECDRKRKGMTTTDGHHVAGEANDPTEILVPVNDHRAELSTAQADWPEQTLENPAGSPLLAGAGCIRGYVDTTLYLAERILLPRAEMLEILDEHLVNQLGPEWWKNTKLEQFQGKNKPNEKR